MISLVLCFKKNLVLQFFQCLCGYLVECYIIAINVYCMSCCNVFAEEESRCGGLDRN